MVVVHGAYTQTYTQQITHIWREIYIYFEYTPNRIKGGTVECTRGIEKTPVTFQSIWILSNLKFFDEFDCATHTRNESNI